jgi:thiosulfate dehydrogenase
MKCAVTFGARVLAASAAAVALSACQADVPKAPPQPGVITYKLNGPLIPARMTMVTAWDFPKNPLKDASLDESTLSKEVKWGYRLFTNTPQEAPQFAPGRGTCNNCHLNGGQRERSMPLVGIAGQFPEYNRRAGRLISLGDRIVDCFLRSQNATGTLPAEVDRTTAAELMPTPTSKEVLALSAYLTWLSKGVPVGTTLAWRGQNAIAREALVPLDKLDPEKGAAIFNEKCVSCHGPDGQGVAVGDKKPGPLWGPDSWNDGAGAARIYTLAGIIRYTMPYLDPGSLTDEDAQQLARFINSKPRPAYPFKDQDYLVDPLPPDSVYYPKRTKPAN